jgi:N-carbamoylputrescine amidase
VPTRVTVAEMSDDREGFAKDWESLAEHVGSESSDLVVLPEMPFYHWFCADPKFDAKAWGEAVEAHESWLKRLPELGARAVLGSRPVNRGRRRFNEGFVWTKKGGVEGVHLKSYLPDEAGYFEASWYDRGDRRFRPFDVAGLKAGMMICSDLWSMRHAREYGKEGVHLLASPRATGRASVEKWVAGGRVAAIVAGAYSFSSNRTGRRGEAEFGGGGWAVDPDGTVLDLTSAEKPFVTVEVDADVAERAKKTYPRDALRPD